MRKSIISKSKRQPVVIVRLKGGLGNQLFEYATGFKIALVKGAALAIDTETGFLRDAKYQRAYRLTRFSLTARGASRSEMLRPFERFRRGIMKHLSRFRSTALRSYVTEEHLASPHDALLLNIRRKTILDGLWQDYRLFQDVAKELREELKITEPNDWANTRTASEIKNNESVAVHIRWFDDRKNAGGNNLPMDYYREAVSLVEKERPKCHYYIFTDGASQLPVDMPFPPERTTIVSHNNSPSDEVNDLWLMSLCKGHIIANSTFSWWGAWLAGGSSSIVIMPGPKYAKGYWIPDQYAWPDWYCL